MRGQSRTFFTERKEAVEGVGAVFLHARWKYRLIYAHEAIVVSTKQRKISKASFGVPDDATHVKVLWLKW